MRRLTRIIILAAAVLAFVSLPLLVFAQGPTPAPYKMPPTLRYVILAASVVGAFCARWLNEQAETFGMRSIVYAALTAGASYLTMQAGFIPDAWSISAETDPLTAGIVAFMISAIAGGGLVVVMQAAVKKFYKISE
jgi:hypothetical protein